MDTTNNDIIKKDKNTWYCYILRNKLDQYRHCTYNGSTNDPIRRLRQHNQEIKGGAKVTSAKPPGSWEYYAVLSGFPDHINALSCEWRIKCPTGRPGKRDARYNGVINRAKSLNEILVLDQWTKQCTVRNSDYALKLLITDDVASYINRAIIPSNIEIVSVPKIGAECFV